MGRHCYVASTEKLQSHLELDSSLDKWLKALGSSFSGGEKPTIAKSEQITNSSSEEFLPDPLEVNF